MKRNKRVILGSILVAILLASMAFVSVNAQVNNNDLPPFQPGIKDKPPFVQLPPNPNVNKEQVKFIGVVLSQQWLNANNKDTDPDLVSVTIPQSRLITITLPAGVPAFPPVSLLERADVRTDEPVALLWIPENIITVEQNEDGSTTLSLPKNFLIFYPSVTEARNILEKRADKRASQLGNEITTAQYLDYSERAWYQRNSTYNVSGVTGIIDPYSYSNRGQKFFSYHELEIYLNRTGDIIEYISYIRDDGGVHIWVALYDENVGAPTQLDVDATALPYMEYYLYLVNGIYWIHLRDPVSGTWYTASYDDTDNPSTYVTWLAGSTELYVSGSITKYFRVETNPLREDWTKDPVGNWYRPKTTFNWYGYSPDQSYVYINTWWTPDNRIETQHVTGSLI